MILLIAGTSHTGKTLLAQKLLERYHYPTLSIDHLKMGLIRSGQTPLTPMDSDEALSGYLWPILREMIKTAIENAQNLIIEGCYIPQDWAKDFCPEYLTHIRCRFLIMTEHYIRTHWADIHDHANDIEQRLEDDLSMEELIADNRKNLELCKKYGCPYLLADDHYDFSVDAFMA